MEYKIVFIILIMFMFSACSHLRVFTRIFLLYSRVCVFAGFVKFTHGPHWGKFPLRSPLFSRLRPGSSIEWLFVQRWTTDNTNAVSS